MRVIIRLGMSNLKYHLGQKYLIEYYAGRTKKFIEKKILYKYFKIVLYSLITKKSN